VFDKNLENLVFLQHFLVSGLFCFYLRIREVLQLSRFGVSCGTK